MQVDRGPTCLGGEPESLEPAYDRTELGQHLLDGPIARSPDRDRVEVVVGTKRGVDIAEEEGRSETVVGLSHLGEIIGGQAADRLRHR